MRRHLGCELGSERNTGLRPAPYSCFCSFRFRKVNVRTDEAQQAPANKYKQLYLESGGVGALRISTVTEGDPVIVGEVFVHRLKSR